MAELRRHPQSILPPAPMDLRIVFLSTYPPRKCGIATYTKDLAMGINNLNPERVAEFIALDNDISESLEYPWEVSHRIRQSEWTDYEKVLDYLNNSVIDVVHIQHEFGIFGGTDGEMVLDFVAKLKKPFIVTFHSTLLKPSENQRRIVHELGKRAHASIVMLPVSAHVLRDIYDVPFEKIVPIHHGAPDFPFFTDTKAKRKFDLTGRKVMTNINLIGPGRGLEYAIAALPDVVKKYPEFLYLIIGQTHPVVFQERGEAYRESLEKQVRDLGLTNNVRFINEYVSLEDLVEYVKASDIYVTPYENMETASSGALAYAIAGGKLCISTPFRYAEEMLTGGKGMLVPPRDSNALCHAILEVLDNPEATKRMREKCYAQGRLMTWERVAFRHVRLLDHILTPKTRDLPVANLDYVRYLTTPRGIVEHTDKGKHLLNEGFATDDNARALTVSIEHEAWDLADVYVGCLERAVTDDGVYCDADETGGFVAQPGYGDWFGRALLGLTDAVIQTKNKPLAKRARLLVNRLLGQADRVTALRGLASILLAVSRLEEAKYPDLLDVRITLRDRALAEIKQAYSLHASDTWQWCEDKLHYDNARIPLAVLEAARVWCQVEWRSLGLRLLDFLIDQTFDVRSNHFAFIGNKGWYLKGQAKARHDEQPLEAGMTVQACYAAYHITGTEYYKDMGLKAFAWYHGDNALRRPLYNRKKSSIYDGLTVDGVNENQGAESILEYLIAQTVYVKLMAEGIPARDSLNSTQSASAAFKTASA